MDLDEFIKELADRGAPKPLPDWHFSGLDDLTWATIPSSVWISIILLAVVAVKCRDYWPQISAWIESRKKND